MPSNKDIIAEITALAAEKGVDVPVMEGLNNAQLAETLKVMKGPAGPAGPGTGDAATGDADNTDKDDDEVEIVKPVKVKRPPYYISDGKSLTTKKGILGPGDEVKIEYLIDGRDGLKRHVENGVITKA
jgi:hypothetical protein